MKKCLKLVALGSMFFAAQNVFAAALIPPGTDLTGLIGNVKTILSSLVGLLVVAALVVFLYGTFIFIAKASQGDAEGRTEGRKFMIYGVIGLAVMISVWGLVEFVTNALGVGHTLIQFNSNAGPVDNSTQNGPERI